MNDIDKLIELTNKEHERNESSARFFWFVFLLDKWLGVAVLLAALAILILWYLHG